MVSPGAQVEAADLARADIDVVRTCQVRAVRGAQEAEAVLQDLQHAVAVDVLAVARMSLQDREDDVLLARTGHVLQAHGLGKLHQVRNRPRLQLREIHGLSRLRQLGGADDLPVIAPIEYVVLRLIQPPGGAVAVAVAVPVVAAAVVAVAVPVAVALARALVRPTPITPLISQIPSHRFDSCLAAASRFCSRKADSCDLDTAPTFWASTDPFLNRINVGMPRMPNVRAVCGFASMSILAIFRRS